MDYTNQKVRRQDRLLDEDKAKELLDKGEYGVMSMVDDEEGAYGVPINYVWDGQQNVYIHCAPEGKKLRCIIKCPSVSFCVVGHTQVIPNKLTTEYQSIILSCTATVVQDETEKSHAIEILLDKYAPSNKVSGMKAASGAFSHVQIIRLKIQNWTGKTKAHAN